MIDLEALSIEQLKAELGARGQLRTEGFNSLTIQASDLVPMSDLNSFSSGDIIDVLINKQTAVYGHDDRLDWYQITDSTILNNAQGVAAIYKYTDVSYNQDGTFSLPDKSLADVYSEGTGFSICSGQRFMYQPTGVFGTAFLVAPDIVVTAGHNFTANSPADFYFVFGYKMQTAQTAITTVVQDQVYTGDYLLEYSYTPNQTDIPDYAVVKLDRPVVDVEPLSIRTTGTIPDQTELYMLGHPSGLPLKYAGNARVTNNQHQAYLTSNLISFAGNSGSPVFNKVTHQVEGIHVRGDGEFAIRENSACLVSLICPSTGCLGADCTRTTMLQSFA